MTTRDWSNASLSDFAEVLKGTNNINTATTAAIQGTGKGGHNPLEDYGEQHGHEVHAFTEALVKKAGLEGKVAVYEAGLAQNKIYRNDDGTIGIEQLEGVISVGPAGDLVGKSATYTIGGDGDFSVTRTERPYIHCTYGKEDTPGKQNLPNALDNSVCRVR